MKFDSNLNYRGDSGHDVALNGNGTTQPGQYISFLNSPAQTKAWIHNSIAMLTPPTRELSALYYGSKPSFSYFSGCSTGGAQGFALAQLHPDLFDGIYAGSPGNWYSHLILSFLWNAKHTKVRVTWEEKSPDISFIEDHANFSPGQCIPKPIRSKLYHKCNPSKM
jgi:hypothetical protein